MTPRAAAQAKTCTLTAAATVPESPERACEAEESRELLVERLTCELAIPELEKGVVLRQPTPGDPP